MEDAIFFGFCADRVTTFGWAGIFVWGKQLHPWLVNGESMMYHIRDMEILQPVAIPQSGI